MVPGGHVVQALSIAAPGVSLYLPQGQGIHAETLVCAVRFWNVPAGHGAQEFCAALAKTPRPQIAHCAEPGSSDMLPDEQRLHVAAPISEYYPGMQSWHVDDVLAPVTNEDVPDGHFTHMASMDAPNTLL